MPKASSKKKQRHDPLHVELRADGLVQSKNREKYTERENRRMLKESNDGYVDPKTSRRLLEIAREQQEEIEAEEGGDEYADFPEDESAGPSDESDEGGEFSEEEYDYEEEELEGEDAAIFEKFMPSAPRERQNLADLIMAKIKQHEVTTETEKPTTDARPTPPGLDKKIVQVYTKIGHLLRRYKSGPVPKAFKIIPSIRNWEEVMYLTSPDTWTPQATYQATRMFVSNMKPKQAQKFLNLVILDRVRDDIAENKKLNYHLYMSLKKSLYKPAAFFKGILFPLCESGTCTLREAVIIGSVLSKISVPMLHSAAALFQLAEMEYSGPTSLFIRVLLDKKYALPYKVLDSLVFHFLRFKQDTRQLPVLWHQSLLVFVQRYKADLTPEQKEALLGLIKVQYHEGMSEEIRREIVHSVCRGEMIVPQDMDVDA
ncbi:snoRNA-binding rRNA-processing protein [Coemansia sp. RSA 989]|nr:Bystin-domain-containing protein [Coemansia mojavensis]KAJ1741931.1 snoRNA-binding rRNA-processing protein [Coemansia sp. RSA 1086]KAJ1750065.1 snoRNA-binding rRNA-processing protein [Coemansia sp. RSA 1821]KAJ1864503.1 snoRNA-binding rRNA-processing protein [Coemansia sp. RSA 989]KAJ1872010.1 snoRNA-binding rRNA-processing protein [Coemansia sp. RSA 990]KAJ2633267.1 snoRNA-binding rRNA-processing protein [Coemansia sp. RSA 1290]KAJ2647249.1 snoRNA-binding rRNA-processing protein [Coemansi